MSVLLHLWWNRHRRSFSWRALFIGLYFAVLFLVLVVAFWGFVNAQSGPEGWPFEVVALVPVLAVAILPADLFVKCFWRRSPVEMDAFLSVRPVSRCVWARFVLFDACAGLFQWAFPLAVALVCALMIPVPFVLLALLLTFSCSLVNACVQNLWRHDSSLLSRCVLATVYVLWLLLMLVLAALSFFALGLAGDDPSMPVDTHRVALAEAFFSCCLIFFNALVVLLLHLRFASVRGYLELPAVADASSMALSPHSWWSYEWTVLFRCPRLRNSFLLVTVIFFLEVYLQELSGGTIQYDAGFSVNPMLLWGIGFPSQVLVQSVLAVEANFFEGIWTRPSSVASLLWHKFLFLCSLCGIMTVSFLPAVVWFSVSWASLIATALYASGAIVLPMMSSCLVCSRLSLFSKNLFNTRGSNAQWNAFSLLMLLPVALYYVIYHFLPSAWAHVIIASIGLLGLLLSKPYIRWVSRTWHRHRYAIMERWRG